MRVYSITQKKLIGQAQFLNPGGCYSIDISGPVIWLKTIMKSDSFFKSTPNNENAVALDLYTSKNMGTVQSLLASMPHKTKEFKLEKIISNGAYQIRLQDNTIQTIKPSFPISSSSLNVIPPIDSWRPYKSNTLFSAKKVDLNAVNNPGNKSSLVIFASTAFGKADWFLARMDQNGKFFWKNNFRDLCGSYHQLIAMYLYKDGLKLVSKSGQFYSKLRYTSISVETGKIQAHFNF